MGLPILGQETEDPQDKNPRIRLFICNRCETIDEIPYWRDSWGDDVSRRRVLEKHNHQYLRLKGADPEAFICDIEEWVWNQPDYRKQVIKRIREDQGHTGLGDQFYDTSNTYREDALKCFERHRRPTVREGCSDYLSPSKNLVNPMQEQHDLEDLTRDERKRLKVMQKQTSHFLCYWCPFYSQAQQSIRDKKARR